MCSYTHDTAQCEEEEREDGEIYGMALEEAEHTSKIQEDIKKYYCLLGLPFASWQGSFFPPLSNDGTTTLLACEI